ncbi:PREDICTED: GATA transcription factor 1-like isoform X2 [Camelina sativa]|uniref:GATA transcription factor 1-like isoform X2 n=1 Tax=Camelina sativa TaxID=90675 RepID=A0ABM0W7H2_CAMSA|nr:PREDICTED: GATA transcription factor 1-like isoform X2 [Camelina sativa]
MYVLPPPQTPVHVFVDGPGVVEEEDLEWISNKDAFPVIETFVGMLPPEHFRVTSPEREAIEGKQLSPVSVLETSSNSSTTTTTSNSSGGSTALATTTSMLMSCCVSFKAPAKARSKRRRTGRRDLRVLWTGNEIQKKKTMSAAAVIIGRKCQHCGAEKTPQWRAGPLGPKTLCNACGVRYKSGRLVPEYRPANSPTFTAELHSNSHRKIVEMRKQYQSGDGDHRKDCG